MLAFNPLEREIRDANRNDHQQQESFRCCLDARKIRPYSVEHPGSSWFLDVPARIPEDGTEPSGAPISSFPVNELTEVGRPRGQPGANRLTRPFPPLWRGGSRRLGRGGFLLLAAACDRQQERSLAAVGNSLGARGLARGRLLRRRLRILRQGALQGLQPV